MNLVVVAADAFTFLFAWEFMSLSSWALVMAHHRDPANAHAGYVYLVMASFGTLSLLLAFGLLAGPSGGYAFAAIRSAELTPGLSALVLALALLGAGSKAGLVPLHAWLPLAHPAAPSHVSALMSGVMTKVAVYGFVRIVFDLLGPPAWWWSVVVLVLGGVTAVLGVLYALMQHDLKRLLAYHTVENIGIIFIGLGLALAFQANAMGFAAALALTAALFHVLNHCLFKSLLFFGAGAVLVASGERDMEHLGGLIHGMPLTAFDLPGRRRGDLRAAAAQRLRLRVADLPGDPGQPRRAAVESEVSGARGRRPARALGRAGRRLLRQGVRADLSRPPAQRGGRAGARGRSPLARRDVRLRRAVRLRRRVPGPDHRRAGAGRDGADRRRAPARRRPTIAWLTVVPVSASRSSYNGLLVLLFIAFSAGGRSLRDPPLRLACRAPRAGLGLRLSRSRARSPSTAPAASRSRSAGCSARWRFAPASRSTCRRPAISARRAWRYACRIWSGRASTRRSRARSASPPTGSTICSS